VKEEKAAFEPAYGRGPVIVSVMARTGASLRMVFDRARDLPLRLCPHPEMNGTVVVR
jgi:hypothetical protein